MPEDPAGAGLHPLHRLWRILPQDARRQLLIRGAALLAPRPDRPAPAAAPGLAVAGELDRPSGIGQGARLMLKGLAALGLPHWAVPGPQPPPHGVPLVIHGSGSGAAMAAMRLGRSVLRGRRVIGYWPWELPVAPPSWRAGLDFVHEIWTCSRFSADALEALLPGRVRVVPYPVAAAPPDPAPLDRAALGLPANTLITLVVFNLASSFVRKNPLGAIEAHRAAFGHRADRLLLLRVGNPHHFPDDFATLRQAAEALPNVRIDTRTLPLAESHAIMAASDIVLSLHRSEGFGLVPAEAMLLGKPVVATDWSSTQEFLDSGCGAPVPVRLIPARDPRGVFQAPGAVWADPDLDAAAAQLIRLSDDPALRAQMGQAAQQAATQRFGTGPLRDAVASLSLGA